MRVHTGLLFISAFFLFLCSAWPAAAYAQVPAEAAEESEKPGKKGKPGGEEETEKTVLEEKLLEDMDLAQVQQMMDEALGENSFSFTEALKKLLTGEVAFSGEALAELFRGLFFSRIQREKSTLAQILALILLAALFANFAAVFDRGQVGEISFYMVYLMLFAILIHSFSAMSLSLEKNLSWMAEFMKGLAPAYFMAVAAANGSSTAAMFYQGVLLLVWLIQWLLVSVILPCTNLYVFLNLANHLSREGMVGKLAELLDTAVNWSLKTLLGMVAGLQIVRAMVSPVMDSLKRSAVGKTASALPGVGNVVNTVTEIVVTSAVLVRNCMGVVVLVVFVLVGIGPVVHYGAMSLAYRLLAAVAQPVSDKRLVECLSTMGEGCSLLLKILFHGQVLCMLTFMILLVSFGGGS